MNFPCKECIQKTGAGCCNTYPIMTYEEAAKIMYEHGDVLKKNNMAFNKIAPNAVMFYKPEDVKNGEIDLTNVVCPFLDRNNAICTIYNDRPRICKEFGESIDGCPYKGQTHITDILPLKKIEPLKLLTENTEFVKEYLKPYKPLRELDIKKSVKIANQKEFHHMLIITNYITHMGAYTDYMESKYVYGFVMQQNKMISPFKRVEIKFKHPFSPLSRIHNFIQRKILVMNTAVLEPLENKLNNALKNIKDIDKDPNPQELLLIALFYAKEYQTKFKNKKTEYGGLLSIDEVYNMEKQLFKELGYDSVISAYNDNYIKEICMLVERMYKVINSLK